MREREAALNQGYGSVEQGEKFGPCVCFKTVGIASVLALIILNLERRSERTLKAGERGQRGRARE